MQEGLNKNILWFVLVLIVLIGFFAIWLYKPKYKKQEIPYKEKPVDSIHLEKGETKTIIITYGE
jgi:hypothetical protein